MALQKRSYDKISEQEIIECTRYNNQLAGCNGGWDDWAYNQIRNTRGVTNSYYNPYAGTTSGKSCKTGLPRAAGSAILSYSVFQRNENAIRDALAAYGPLFIVFRVTNDFFSYRSGVYTDARNQCGTNVINHAVLLVGYGNEGGRDYWLLKNSWGEILITNILQMIK